MAYCTSCGSHRSPSDRTCRVCRQPLPPLAEETALPAEAEPEETQPLAADPAAQRTVEPRPEGPPPGPQTVRRPAPPSDPPADRPAPADLPTMLPPAGAPAAADAVTMLPGGPGTAADPGATGVPEQPTPTAPFPETGPDQPTPTTPFPQPAHGGPPPGGTVAPARPRRHPVSYLLAVVGLVLAVVASTVVLTQFLRMRGGAESPEAAVSGIVEAIVAQDPIGVIDLVTPAEVEGLDSVYGGAVGKATAAGLVGKDELLDAVTIQVHGLELDTEELSNGLARVTVTGGEYELNWDTDRLPPDLDFLGESGDASFTGDLVPLLSGFIDDTTTDLAAAVIEEQSPLGLPIAPPDADLDPTFLTMSTDDRWYVSLLGTYVDWMWLTVEETSGGLASTFLGDPDWEAADEPGEAVVGKDPDDVAANMEEAINSGDGEAILATLPPELVRPLAPYHKIIGMAADLVDVDISDLDYQTSDDGDLQKVVLEDGRVSADPYLEATPGDGGCIDYQVAGIDREYCWPEESGIDETFLMLRKSGDGYQLDPIATVVAHLEIWVAHATDETIRRMLASLKEQMS